MVKQNWLLVANGSQANIFKYSAQGQSLERVNTLTNSAANQQDQDLVTDRPGIMSGGGKNIPGQSALTSEESPTDRAKEDFAKTIATELDAARRQDKMHSLDIIAAPEMLGLIREKMDKNLAKLVDISISKDLLNKSEEELLAALNR